MANDRDHYQAYYQDKLWNMLPAIYRSLDSDSFNTNGPLRELVNRIGAQVAVLRRSIDHLWEDQSIETCDDWVIAYIGDLLATNLVASLDARAQRLDVAKTIYYRRRKGTVSLLEELAADITGWDARVVEFFRRMGRTRHNFDPEIGLPSATPDPAGVSALQLEQGLTGFWTKTAIGGWADLRNRYGALKMRTAFDEYFHTADFRKGVDMVGWHNIPRLGVFLWRLYSFAADQGTPVPVQNCPNQYSFDPTGREIPLYAAASRTRSISYGDNWVTPQEWQLPGAVSTALLAASFADPATIPLYSAMQPDGVTIAPNSFGVFTGIFTSNGAVYSLLDPVHFVDGKRITVFPEIGRFKIMNPPANQTPFVTYHYGFSSTIGARHYDRRIPGVPDAPLVQPVAKIQNGDPVTLQTPSGTTIIQDSITYTNVANATGIQQSAVRAAAVKRPVLRLPAASTWVLTGDDESSLVLDGLLISGGDIVLRGKFASVTLTCCTLDPGNAGTSTVFATSVDGRDLRPSRLWIEAEVRTLTLDRCITGPIRTRDDGDVETMNASDSILQGIRTSGFGLLTADDIADPIDLALVLRADNPLSAFLNGALDAPTRQALAAWDGASALPATLAAGILTGLNHVLSGPSIYQAVRFADVPLNPDATRLLGLNPTSADLIHLNRSLLESAFPLALAQPALALPGGIANLTRCTLLGGLFVHQLEASECILDEFGVVEDVQHGCVRFTTWAAGSVLPRQFESVEVPGRSAIFNSREFGRPEYAQLSPAAPVTILQGAENGSEMGAFAREKNPIKEHSLLIKYQEFMPLGLVPVVVHVT
jgi:hypothetical protein